MILAVLVRLRVATGSPSRGQLFRTDQSTKQKVKQSNPQLRPDLER